jgi:Copine
MLLCTTALTTQGISGIVDAYYASLTQVQLFGPTLFAPVISQAAAIAASMQTPDPA